MTTVSMSKAPGRASNQAEEEPRLDLRRQHRYGENIIQGFLFLGGAVSILTTVGIVYVLSLIHI